MVVFYEDVISGQLGREIAHHFAGENGQEQTIAAWDAALLDEPHFSGFIAGQAANATMIVVALGSADGLTPSLKRWIQHWTVQEQHKHRAVVVAMQKSESRWAARVPAFVRTTARRAGKDFFREEYDECLSSEHGIRHEASWLI